MTSPVSIGALSGHVVSRIKLVMVVRRTVPGGYVLGTRQIPQSFRSPHHHDLPCVHQHFAGIAELFDYFGGDFGFGERCGGCGLAGEGLSDAIVLFDKIRLQD